MKRHLKFLTERDDFAYSNKIEAFVLPVISGKSDSFKWWTFHMAQEILPNVFNAYQNGKGDLHTCLKAVKKSADTGHKEYLSDPDDKEDDICGIVFPKNHTVLGGVIIVAYNPRKKKYMAASLDDDFPKFTYDE